MATFKNFLKRAFALLFIFLYFISTHCRDLAALPRLQEQAAVKSFFPADLSSIRIPSRIGSIEKITSSHGSKTVFLIQDAHSIPEAQKNISKIIQYLTKTFGVPLVGVEGAAGDLDGTLFKTYPEPAKLKALVSSLLAKGEIPGPVLALLSPAGENSHYTGLEDWPAYEEAIALYLQAFRGRSFVLQGIEKEKALLQSKKQSLYPAQLLAIDRAEEEFRRDPERLTEFLTGLSHFSPPASSSVLHDLVQELQSRETEKFKVEIERIVKVLEKKSQKIGLPQQKEFQSNLQAYRTNHVTEAGFLLFLVDFGAKQKINIVLSRSAFRAAKNWRRIKTLKGSAFSRDLDAWLLKIKAPFLKQPSLRRLDEQTRKLHLLSQLGKLELTPPEWKELKSSLSRLEFKKSGPGDLEDALAFYRNSEKREAFFFDHLRTLMTRDSQNTAAFVGGGFHIPGLESLFGAEGFNVVVIQPKITDMPEHNAYQAHMQGNVSWKTDLIRDGNEILVYESFIHHLKTSLFHSSSERQGVLVKAWHDQIIRELANTGKIDRAGEYLALVDEKSGNNQSVEIPTLPPALQKRFDQFSTGLKALRSQNKLSEQAIFDLLQSLHAIAVLSSPSLAVPHSRFQARTPQNRNAARPQNLTPGPRSEARVANPPDYNSMRNGNLLLSRILRELPENLGSQLQILLEEADEVKVKKVKKNLPKRLRGVLDASSSYVLESPEQKERIIQKILKKPDSVQKLFNLTIGQTVVEGKQSIEAPFFGTTTREALVHLVIFENFMDQNSKQLADKLFASVFLEGSTEISSAAISRLTEAYKAIFLAGRTTRVETLRKRLPPDLFELLMRDPAFTSAQNFEIGTVLSALLRLRQSAKNPLPENLEMTRRNLGARLTVAIQISLPGIKDDKARWDSMQIFLLKKIRNTLISRLDFPKVARALKGKRANEAMKIIHESLLHLTKEQAAKALGIPFGTYRKLEAGTHPLRPYARTIAHVYIQEFGLPETAVHRIFTIPTHQELLAGLPRKAEFNKKIKSLRESVPATLFEVASGIDVAMRYYQRLESDENPLMNMEADVRNNNLRRIALFYEKNYEIPAAGILSYFNFPTIAEIASHLKGQPPPKILKSLREFYGKNGSEIANLAHIKRTTYAGYEGENRRRRRVTPKARESLLKVYEELGMPPALFNKLFPFPRSEARTKEQAEAFKKFKSELQNFLGDALAEINARTSPYGPKTGDLFQFLRQQAGFATMRELPISLATAKSIEGGRIAVPPAVLKVLGPVFHEAFKTKFGDKNADEVNVTEMLIKVSRMNREKLAAAPSEKKYRFPPYHSQRKKSQRFWQ